jgi:hypothetical protein
MRLDSLRSFQYLETREITERMLREGSWSGGRVGIFFWYLSSSGFISSGFVSSSGKGIVIEMEPEEEEEEDEEEVGVGEYVVQKRKILSQRFSGSSRRGEGGKNSTDGTFS